MKKILFYIFMGSLSLVSLAAIAIDGPRQDQKVTLTLSIPEVNLILKGIGKLQLDESIDVFASIQRQVASQLAPKQKIDSNANSNRSQKKN